MLRQARRALLSGLSHTGIFTQVANSPWRRGRLAILCYHGVSIDDEHEWHPQLYITADFLQKRFEILKRGRYNVVPLGEGLRRLHDGTLPPRSVALTFDDGAHDFYLKALPLLREYQFPATVYLTTYYCNYQRPVFDTGYSYLLWKSGLPDVDLSGLVPGGGRVSLATSQDRRNATLAIRAWANDSGLSAADKDDLLRRLAKRIGLDYDRVFSSRRLYQMSPDEVRQCAAAGIDIGLHTHRHRTPDDERLFVKEIEDNAVAIERILGSAAGLHFCYPSGAYRNQYVDWLGKAGVHSATTCDFGVASRSDDVLLLPRIVDTLARTSAEFEAWISGVLEFLPHRRHFPDPEGADPAYQASPTDAAA